jgi:hypothetical protein
LSKFFFLARKFRSKNAEGKALLLANKKIKKEKFFLACRRFFAALKKFLFFQPESLRGFHVDIIG